MTDQEVADTAAMAGEAAGAGTRANIQDLERNAAASGNSDALAVAAMRSQYMDQGAVNQADAVANAQLAARAQQRQAATGVEQTRLGANQYQAGATIGAGEAMGNLATGATTQEEAMRMAGAQDVSNRQLGIAQTLGTVGQQNANTIGNEGITQAQNLQQGGLQAGEFSQGAAANYASAGDAAAAARAAAIAANRQTTAQNNQGNQFNRGYQVNSQLSNLYGQTGAARIAGQNNQQNFWAGQQNYQGGQKQAANTNLLNTQQLQQQGTNQATAGNAQWELGNKNSPNWFTKNVVPLVAGSKYSSTSPGGGSTSATLGGG
jgi:hypothetical protein